jgi:hypothetical protein
MLSRIPLEPLAWGYCVRGFGSGLRIALNLAPIHHEKSACGKCHKRFLFASFERLA